MTHSSSTRASEYPQLIQGLTDAIADYHLVEGGSFQISHQVTRLRELIAQSSPNLTLRFIHGLNMGMRLSTYTPVGINVTLPLPLITCKTSSRQANRIT